jgi:hypothetical protein
MKEISAERDSLVKQIADKIGRLLISRMIKEDSVMR